VGVYVVGKGLGRADGEAGEGRTILWGFFLRRRILMKYFCMPHMLKALSSLMSSGQNYTFSTH